MQITIITLFPQVFEQVFSVSILKRAQEENKLKIKLLNLRDFGIGKHKVVDDRPYGGGAGMVLRVDVLDHAIQSARQKHGKEVAILLDPKGEPYHQKRAEFFSKFDHIILVCGHYEGVDERVRSLVDYEISIGDYILSGGEIAAMVMIDTIARLIPGVLKKAEATSFESFTKIDNLIILEYPHYTRPPKYKKIEEYRIKKAQEITKKRRPDILRKIKN